LAADGGVGSPVMQARIQARLAKMYAEGKGVPKSFERAAFYAEKSSTSQEPIFGDIYRSLAEAESVPEKYFALYAKAAKAYANPAANLDNGSTSGSIARSELGHLYAAAASEGGSADARYKLGTIFQSGKGVGKENHKEALRWYQLAANQNHKDALYELGKMYAAGNGVNQNKRLALENYKNAASQKHPKAMLEAAKLYEYEDKAKSLELYKEAAACGVVEAQCALGKMFATGRGVPVDFAQSADYYSAAANQGDLNAQLVLLKAFFRLHNRADVRSLQDMEPYGNTDPADIFKYAVNSASEAGHLGQYYLGMCYSDGIGVEKNAAEAAVHLDKAANPLPVKYFEACARADVNGVDPVFEPAGA